MVHIWVRPVYFITGFFFLSLLRKVNQIAGPQVADPDREITNEIHSFQATPLSGHAPSSRFASTGRWGRG